MSADYRIPWAKRIEKALRNRGRGFTAQDEEDAGFWLTCAVGEKLHWNEEGLPKDDEWYGTKLAHIKDLGLAFWRCVDANDPESAYARLGEIAREANRIRGKK